MSERGLDFSFSGLKTSLVYRVRDLGAEETERRRADLAASFQRAIVDQLVAKLGRAARSGEWPAIALGGGVAANAELRERTEALCGELGLRLKLVPISLCTDNAAMIGSAARYIQPIPIPTISASMPSRLVLYGRPDCHLCDEARAGLKAMLADGLRLRARGGEHRVRRGAARPLPRAHPGGRARRRDRLGALARRRTASGARLDTLSA